MNSHLYRILFFALLCLPIGLLGQQKKNVLLIMVDDMNDYVNAFGGHPQSITPNIDKLASKGVAFQNASCSSPVCNPSRTAFMTGRRPHETGYENNAGANNAKNFRDNPNNWIKNLTTLPQYFSSQGYKTVAQGKLFHTHGWSKGEFQTLGPGGQGANGGTKQTIPNTDDKLTWSKSGQTLKQTGDFKSADYGANFLKQNHNKPFFLGIGIFRPHIPLHAPKEFYDALPAVNDIVLPPLWKANDRNDTYGGSNNYRQAIINNGGDKPWKEWTQAYLANISFADACLGHVLEALEKSSYAENTIVVLVSDHGWHMGEKEHVLKFTMWDRAIKTPMIIYDPSGGSGNCQKAVSLQDIYPTLISLTGIAKPSFTLRGRNIAPLVKNPNASWCGAALTTYSGSNSIRSDRYRYIKYKNGKEELYDHEKDPGEWTNLAGKNTHSDVLQDMRQALTKMLNFNENPFGNGCPGDGTDCTSMDSDNDGVNNCDDQCPLDPEKSAPGNCGCGVAETPGCGISTPTDINDLEASVTACSVYLTWSDVAGETGYRVRRKVEGDATFTNIGDVNAGVTEFTDEEVQAFTDYVYMVRPLVDGKAVAVSNQPNVPVGACIITGSEEIDASEVALSPNPTTGIIHLSREVHWTVHSLEGSLLLQGFGNRADLSGFPLGSYLIKTQGSVHRIVKH